MKKRLVAIVGIAITLVILAGILVPAAIASRGEQERKCMIHMAPENIKTHGTTNITVQIVRGIPGATYKGTAYVTKGSINDGHAVYLISTNPGGAGQTTHIFPTDFAGGKTDTERKTTYTVVITLTSQGYGYDVLHCSGTFAVGDKPSSA